MPIITLTTDFGLNDWFVGTMRGVILGVAPRTSVVDITHGTPSGDIRAGAFVLAAAYRYFPRRTIHVAVIDPGVGGSRAGIVVQTADYFFVAPDNGVLSLALSRERIKAVRRLQNEAYFLQPVSRTFHGRDVFARVAAHLSRGVPPSRLGPTQSDFVRLSWPSPKRERNAVKGEIVYIDGFGNAITNIPTEQSGQPQTHQVSVRGQTACPVKHCYEEAEAGQLTAISGSSDFLELAVRNGSAARVFRLKVGDPVTVRSS
jgi:S-adenosylmethionine hydrolase